MLEPSDLSGLGLPIQLPRSLYVNSARIVAEGMFRPTVVPKELSEELTEITGVSSEEFPLSTRIFEFDLQESDSVIVQAAENNLPLIVCRDEEVIVNFEIRTTQAFQFLDSKRPIYTYIPGFNIQKIPPAVRRPLSNFVQSLSSRKKGGGERDYSKLPLRSFELVILLLNKIVSGGLGRESSPFRWPLGKRAVFISVHDVDTEGLLRRGERDPLFLIEQNHRIHSTWFIPTAILKERMESIRFLLESGNEAGWHGYKHDHRLAFKPFAEQCVEMLKKSWFAEPNNYPTGMRCPRLLKSNHLFEVLERSCSALCYDTSFAVGIVPYFLWLNRRESKILEIPITVPTDIAVYNQLHSIPRSRRGRAILDAQIARTKKLLDVGGIISIVTHPEKDLSEQPEFLDIYDQYLQFIKSLPDIWFATAGELFKYWTRDGLDLAVQSQSLSKPSER